ALGGGAPSHGAAHPLAALEGTLRQTPAPRAPHLPDLGLRLGHRRGGLPHALPPARAGRMSPAPTRPPDRDPDGTRPLAARLLLHFLLRRDGAGWPGGPPLPRGVATLATGILLASSLTMEFATRSVRGARLDRLPTWVGSTLAMGVIFLALVLWLWFEWTSGG